MAIGSDDSVGVFGGVSGGVFGGVVDLRWDISGAMINAEDCKWLNVRDGR